AGHGRDRPVRPGSHPPDEPRHARGQRRPDDARVVARLDRGPRPGEARLAHAGDAARRPGARAARGLPDDAPLGQTMAVLDPTIAVARRETGRTSVLATLHEWVVTVDHKRLGLMYIASGLVFFLVAGTEATIMRIQLAVPENHFVSPQVFNRMFTMHGTTMVFFVGMPIVLGFANYLVPLMIGARDMAF